ncbi:hypothetical protein ACN28E_18345 [Archangium lansingense]|uniref:hypothetical protein n=1 Tax=Archangium lansingense TaxID=2995310 RepID=UPI003B78CE69
MNILDTLANAALFIASRRQAAHSMNREQEEKIWLYVRALSHFVHVTGQAYRFEDFLDGTIPTEPHVSPLLSAHRGSIARRAIELLKTLDEPTEPADKQHVLVLIALLDFITDTGQLADVENFFNHQLEYAPVAIAHFASHEEAETWLKGLTQPPSPARILIGDEYHQFWYMREDGTRGMYRDHAIEPALEALVARGIPPQVPSFTQRVEAESWLMSHPAAPYAFVAIAGEYYFAVHHWRLNRHSLHHVASTLKEWDERKKAVDLEKARE